MQSRRYRLRLEFPVPCLSLASQCVSACCTSDSRSTSSCPLPSCDHLFWQFWPSVLLFLLLGGVSAHTRKHGARGFNGAVIHSPHPATFKVWRQRDSLPSVYMNHPVERCWEGVWGQSPCGQRFGFLPPLLCDLYGARSQDKSAAADLSWAILLSSLRDACATLYFVARQAAEKVGFRTKMAEPKCPGLKPLLTGLALCGG